MQLHMDDVIGLIVDDVIINTPYMCNDALVIDVLCISVFSSSDHSLCMELMRMLS